MTTGGIDKAAILRKPPIDSLLDSGAMPTLVEPSDRQMTIIAVSRRALVADVKARMDAVLAAYRALFDFAGVNHGALDELVAGDQAAALVDELILANDETARLAAVRVMKHLVSVAEAQSRNFWGSDLGRVVASRGGFGAAAMPRIWAEELLGVSKQRIGQMVTDRLLAKGTDGYGIEPASLARLLVIQEEL